MLINTGMNGIEDWLDKANNVVGGVGKIKKTYQLATEKPKPVIVQQGLFSGGESVNLDRTMMLYLGAGAVALLAILMVMKK